MDRCRPPLAQQPGAAWNVVSLHPHKIDATQLLLIHVEATSYHLYQQKANARVQQWEAAAP